MEEEEVDEEVVEGEGLSRFDEGFFDKEGFLNSSFSFYFPFSALTLLFISISSAFFFSPTLLLD